MLGSQEHGKCCMMKKRILPPDGKRVLDPCCGSRMFYFDKSNADIVFGDIRNEQHVLCDGRALSVSPDVILDFRDLPYASNSFSLVVFDPPHLKRAGVNSWTAKKYGLLSSDWRSDIKAGFSECFRVLKEDGVLVFKWNETQILLKDILQLVDKRPLFGHRSGVRSNTHWLCFIK
jgi:ubiquinone/menaquinone biosynthesis C-methylase UbiE